MTPDQQTRRIVEKAGSLGFDLCGVASAEKFPELEHLQEWLGRGYAGEMRYLHNPKRQSPELVVPGARSVIVCAMNYNTPPPYSLAAKASLDAQSRSEPRAWISRYAWGDDYHEVLGARLEQLTVWMRQEFREPHQSRWYVDTGPIVERVAAKWAGLGWLGKNTCLINEEFGSWLFLGVVITTLELLPSLRPREGSVAPPPDLCGQCRQCIDACPTAAIVEPYVLDARRCISYLTIELRGAIPREYQENIGWHLFGCDICQDVCPYNRHAPVTDKKEFLPRSIAERETLYTPPANLFTELTEEQFEKQFAHSAMRRAKQEGLRRNAAIVQGLHSANQAGQEAGQGQHQKQEQHGNDE